MLNSATDSRSPEDSGSIEMHEIMGANVKDRPHPQTIMGSLIPCM